MSTVRACSSAVAPVALIVVTIAAFAGAALPAAAELPRVEHSPSADGSLTILAVGDWGRRGEFNQSRVTAQKMGVDFVISTGDNFYDDGLTGVDDKAFEESFTGIYTAKSLQKPWYTVLGNHDYRGDALAQISPVLRRVDSRWICMKSFVVDAEIADFFFVDTTPFVLKYWTNPKNSTYDWRGVAPRETYITNLLKAHGVDLYLNGHDHCLEHISSTDSPLQYLTSGGGSKSWGGVYAPGGDKVEFFHDGQGFMSLRLTGTEASLAFHGVAGDVLHI
ncbi:hypothetical protein BRADI_4g16607v3 [Brachypodium distachyon]|uniref:acid phosphatase n=1 Tax=Brachypodium distachyon TaxID=15368 RepID=A0A0Q3EPN3_BRADI|nr:hypothetical protein BRADI_4g16607v3 [Brachypodium distachyon]